MFFQPYFQSMVSVLKGCHWTGLCVIVLLSSCEKDSEAPLRSEAWVPVYLDAADAKEIESQAARAPVAGGKIYAYQDYLFQLEPNLGIHVYELVDKKPEPYRFIQVYGAQEISIKNGYLYTNNNNDLVSVNISDFNQAKEVGRVSNVFKLDHYVLPPDQGYFECVDPEKGTVIGWELKSNVRAKCRYW